MKADRIQIKKEEFLRYIPAEYIEEAVAGMRECNLDKAVNRNKKSILFRQFKPLFAAAAAAVIVIFGGGIVYACVNGYLFFEDGRLIFSFNKNVVEEIADNTEWENDGERFSFSVSEYQESMDDGIKYTEYDSLSDFSEAEISANIRQLCDEQIKDYRVRCSRDDDSWRVEVVCGENGVGVRGIDIEPFGFSDYLAGSEKEGVNLEAFQDGDTVYLISAQDDITTIFYVDDALLYTLIVSPMRMDEAENFIKNYLR